MKGLDKTLYQQIDAVLETLLREWDYSQYTANCELQKVVAQAVQEALAKQREELVERFIGIVMTAKKEYPDVIYADGRVNPEWVDTADILLPLFKMRSETENLIKDGMKKLKSGQAIEVKGFADKVIRVMTAEDKIIINPLEVESLGKEGER